VPSARLSAILCIAILAACTEPHHDAPPRDASPSQAISTLYTSPDAPADGPIGTFDRTRLLVAYYGSAEHAAQMADLTRRRDGALRAGDTSLAAALSAEGQARQDAAHAQLAGTAPLTNIASDFHAAIEHLARLESVSRIVATDAAPPGVRAVDLTDPLIALMPPARCAR